MNSQSLNEIAYNILNSLRGGRSSHSEHYSLDQIKFTINYYRALLIRRDQERNFNRSQMFEQDLGHLPTEIIDSAEDDTVSSGNMVMKTINEIPAPVRLKRSQAITHISCPDKVGRPIPLLDDSRSYWEQFNKYTSDNIHASFRNGYIYIFNNSAIQTLHVRGIFEDPEEVFKFKDSNGIEVYTGDEPYPISQDMLQRITQSILNTEGQMTIQTPNDEEMDRNQDSNTGDRG